MRPRPRRPAASGATIGLSVALGCAAPPVEPPELAPAPPRTPVLEAPAPAADSAAMEPIPRELSVEDAAMLALRNNRDLRVQKLGPVIAGTFERIERGAFDPEVFAEGSFFQENASQTARATGERFDVEGRSTNVRAGVRKRFSTGTELEAIMAHQFDVSDRTPEQQEARFGLSMTQQLLRGFGPAVNLASVRQARLEAEASRHEMAGFVQSLLADTEIAYWRLVLAEKEIAIFERSLEVARRERREIEDRIEVGALPELDAAPARAQVARREQALIDAESRLRAARLRLSQLIAPDRPGRLDAEIVATSDPRVDNPLEQEADARVRLAEQYRPEVAEAELRLQQDRLETVVTRNGVLPQLDFFVDLGKTGFSDSAPGAFGALGEDTYDIRAGLSVSRAIARGAAEARDRRARATARQSRAALENLRQLVRLDVRIALNELDRARAQIDASAATRTLEERTVAAEKERFEVGAGTALLVAQAQRDLLSSQIEEVRAIVDYRVALVNLFLAEGTLLARRGITVR